jgi:hypothetical protein
LVDFLKFAVESELNTGGGLVDLVAMGLLALLVAGDPCPGILALINWETERLAHLIEKLLEYRAAKQGFRFRPTPLQPRHAARERESKSRQQGLIIVAIFAFACVLSVGSTGYASHLSAVSQRHSKTTAAAVSKRLR